jgi:hypothetical protein
LLEQSSENKSGYNKYQTDTDDENNCGHWESAGHATTQVSPAVDEVWQRFMILAIKTSLVVSTSQFKYAYTTFPFLRLDLGAIFQKQ